MKVKAPQPFTFGNGKRAVLLLHGFTGIQQMFEC